MIVSYWWKYGTLSIYPHCKAYFTNFHTFKHLKKKIRFFFLNCSKNLVVNSSALCCQWGIQNCFHVTHYFITFVKGLCISTSDAHCTWISFHNSLLGGSVPKSRSLILVSRKCEVQYSLISSCFDPKSQSCRPLDLTNLCLRQLP